MPIAGLATLWPSPENYARFKEICDDQIHETYEDYVASAGKKLGELEKRGVVFQRIGFDPDELAAWCRAEFGKVNSESRAAYAAVLAAQQDNARDGNRKK